jgi:2-polyprenyl-3-methyl-5-hydroxy-6-metoxy-1,4-benzoquinol methylase
MIYMIRLSPPTIEYAADYFFGFYKKQYGKTYLEDFPNLITIGKKRLESIKTLLPLPLRKEGFAGTAAGGESLLDIGCAYGPFLAAAKEEGFEPEGMDAAEDAVRYVREELRIPARAGFFPNSGAGESDSEKPWKDGQFSVATLWYVIEHFEDLVPVLKEINRLLKDGGVLAFSTPSFSGISGWASPEGFLEKSPGDHYTVWSPGICGKLLARYGFDLKKITVTGHHPERFPLGGRFLRVKGWISRIFGLGDTFEAYAVKRERCND